MGLDEIVGLPWRKVIQFFYVQSHFLLLERKKVQNINSIELQRQDLEEKQIKKGGGDQMTKDDKVLTTNFGKLVDDDQNILTAGTPGPTLMQDIHLLEKLAHFDRERIPERVVHAKGTGAYGYFEVTSDVTQYTKAKFLSEVGKRTEMFARFSTVGGEKGSADARDHLIGNIGSHLGNAQKRIQLRQCALFYKADPDYGHRVAEGLEVDKKEVERLAEMSDEERAKATAE